MSELGLGGIVGRWTLAGAVSIGLAAAPVSAASCSVAQDCPAVDVPAAPTVDAMLTMSSSSQPAERDKGLALLEGAAENGDVGAQVQLALIHAEGRFGQPVDKVQAAKLFDMAAARGSDFARVQLALQLLGAVGVAEDVPRAVKLLEAANSGGDVWATTLLAGLYVEGRQVPADGERAIELLTPLAAKQAASALTGLGDVYAKGPAPIATDTVKAFDYYERAAKLGDITGKSRLGTILVSRTGKTADVARGLGLLEDVAQAGDAWTLIQIGNLYAAGQSVPLDGGKALEYYRHAAEAGLSPGYSLMGNVYKYGLGEIAKDGQAAAGYYEKALVGDDNTARVQLALMLLDGTSLPSNVDRAVELLEAAQKTGDIWSTTVLAGLYTSGDKVAADGTLAVSLLEPLVAAGNGAAMTALGDVYAKGPAPVKVDANKAYDLFEKAAALGDIGGKSRLGTLLVANVDKPDDVSRGLSLLEDVAKAGDGWTLIQIGNLYAAGKAVPLDGLKALLYYQRAATGGIASGYSLMGNVYNGGLGVVDKDLKKAADFYERAVAAKDNTGRVQLALMLLDGNGVPKNVKRALVLLDDAAKTGDLWSTTILATVYADGRYVPADYKKARGYYDAAEKMGYHQLALPFGLSLASGPLADKHGAEGAALIRSAVSEGIAEAAVSLARLQIAGRVPGDNFDDASRTLEQAIQAGDTSALRYLIALYRYGVPGQVTPRVAAVKSLLDSHGDLLPAPERAFETIYVMAQPRSGERRLESIDTEFALLNPQDVPKTMQYLLITDPNAYVYVLQRRLSTESIYKGPMSGMLTSPTLRAIAVSCRQMGAADVCGRGVLTGEAADVLSSWLVSTGEKTN